MTRLLLMAAIGLAPLAASSQSMPSWAAPSSPQAADPAPPQKDDAPPPPGVPQQVPIDGGLGLLALAGGAYAVRKLRKDPS